MTDAALASALATEAGEYLLQLRASGEVAPQDLKARGDAGSQELLARRLHEERPDDAVLSEESGERAGGNRRWILDPIDGTFNFVEQAIASSDAACRHSFAPITS